jgi:hypothetical protein
MQCGDAGRAGRHGRISPRQLVAVERKGALLFSTFLVWIGARLDPHDQRIVADRIGPAISKTSLDGGLVLVWRTLIAPAACELRAAGPRNQPEELAVSAEGEVAARLGTKRLRPGARAKSSCEGCEGFFCNRSLRV